MTKAADNHLAYPKLDKNFLNALRFMWRSVKTVAALLRYLGDRGLSALGYEKINKTDYFADLNFDQAEPCLRQSSLDKRAFQSFGGVRWVSDLSLGQIEYNSHYDYPNPHVLRVIYSVKGEKKESSAECQIHGDLQSHELDLVGDVLASLLEELKILVNPIRTIHFVEDLGRFLSAQGTPRDKVPGFTLDSKGALLAIEDIAFEEGLCYRFFKRVLDDELNREATIKRSREALWNQQDAIVRRISKLKEYTPPTSRHRFGSLRARQIIDLDTPIKDGVYLGWPAREAIAVDGSRLNAAYEKLLYEARKLKEPLGLGFEEKLMLMVNDLVRLLLPRSSKEALTEFRHKNRIVQDQEVSLGQFLAAETGACDHRALLAAYLMERIAEDQPEYLSGSVSIDRNWFPGKSHSWVRYRAAQKNVYIVDPANSLVLRLDDYSKPRWAYERPADLARPRVQRPIQLPG